MVLLKQWWTAKYHQSVKSKEFQSYTLLELLTEFHEDLYLKDRRAMLKAEKESSGGHVRLPSYGDAVIEKWEQELEKGKFPDLLEGLPPEERKKAMEAMKKREKSSNKKQERGIVAFIEAKKKTSDYEKLISEIEEFKDIYNG